MREFFARQLGITRATITMSIFFVPCRWQL